MQFGINYKRSRFTTFSPSTLIFGSNNNDIPDLKFAIQTAKKDLKSIKFNNDEYQYLQEFQTKLKTIKTLYKEQWTKYVWHSKK